MQLEWGAGSWVRFLTRKVLGLGSHMMTPLCWLCVFAYCLPGKKHKRVHSEDLQPDLATEDPTDMCPDMSPDVAVMPIHQYVGAAKAKGLVKGDQSMVDNRFANSVSLCGRDAVPEVQQWGLCLLLHTQCG